VIVYDGYCRHYYNLNTLYLIYYNNCFNSIQVFAIQYSYLMYITFIFNYLNLKGYALIYKIICYFENIGAFYLFFYFRINAKYRYLLEQYTQVVKVNNFMINKSKI